MRCALPAERCLAEAGTVVLRVTPPDFSIWLADDRVVAAHQSGCAVMLVPEAGEGTPLQAYWSPQDSVLGQLPFSRLARDPGDAGTLLGMVDRTIRLILSNTPFGAAESVLMQIGLRGACVALKAGISHKGVAGPLRVASERIAYWRQRRAREPLALAGDHIAAYVASLRLSGQAELVALANQVAMEETVVAARTSTPPTVDVARPRVTL